MSAGPIGGGHSGPIAASGVPAALATLKDVTGIAGSFVVSSSGRLVGREISPMFDSATLAEAGERLTRLRDTFATVGDELDLAVIRYQDYKLYLKALSGGMLCILADGVVNMAALRMAANLVGKRIAPVLEQPDFDLPAVPGSRSPEATGPVLASADDGAGARRPPVMTPGTGRRFRGRSVE
jgi:predicted regulator of Ras-like GTPase activity (Roadblock/LC7/MglB family)